VIQEGILREEDALTDLSNVLGQLKDMSLQMHSEISRSAFLSDFLTAKTINRNPSQNSPSQLFFLSSKIKNNGKVVGIDAGKMRALHTLMQMSMSSTTE
jgi:hypothetical protein